MTPERWRRVEDLFDAASELDAGARPAWLAEACADDPGLRAEVERMLAADGAARASLENAVDAAVDSTGRPPANLSGLRIGAYEILSEIGRGGMGLVYLARRDDDVFRKEVALKVVRGGLEAAHVLERFKEERRILARLEHPYIARILDGGSTPDGAPFLVLEYVKGQPITAYSAARSLGLRERLELFRKVCAAVQYAHQNLVVHRDLKPGNIFVDEQGDPKLLDFGIAKLLDADPEATRTVDFGRLLTPQYASPEQVNGEPVTAASDVYSLGAVLYELVTGKAAHQLNGLSGVAYYKEICEREVTRASLAARQPGAPFPPRVLEGDLDAILRMALEKDPRRRYATADRLSDDIRRHLEYLPVRATAGSFRHRALKFLRRNRGPVAAAALIAATLIGGIAATSYQARRAERRLQEGRHLASSFVFDVYDALSKLPGATKARELVVNRALAYLKNMEREAPDDPGLQFELATAYRKIADVQGSVSYANLGDVRAAVANYQTADRLLRRVLARRPDDGPARLELVRVLSQQGRTRRHTGDLKEALEDFRKASEDAASLAAGKETLDVRAELGSLLESMAQVQRDSGDAGAALASAERGVELLEGVLREEPARDHTRERLAAAVSSLAMSKARMNDLNGAVIAVRRSVELLEALPEKRKHEPEAQHSIMAAYGALGDLLGSPTLPSVGDRAGAEAAYRSALALAEAVVAVDPNNRLAQIDVAIVLIRLAAVLPSQKNAEAISACDRAYKIFSVAVSADPDNINTRMNMAHGLLVRGLRKVDSGDGAAAMRDFRLSREMCRGVLSSKPNHVNVERVLMRGLGFEVRQLAAQGRRQEALLLAREALTLADRRNSDRVSAFDLIMHARAYSVMATAVTGDEACSWMKRSLEAWDATLRNPGSNILVERERKLVADDAAHCH